MRKLVDKVLGLEIVKIQKPDGELIAYQVEDREARPIVLARVPFLRMAREEAEKLGRYRHASS